MKKKLCKDRENGKLLGVLSGIAQYLSMDVTTVRVCYVLLSLFFMRTAIGILLYIILSFVMPDKSEIGHSDYEIK